MKCKSLKTQKMPIFGHFAGHISATVCPIRLFSADLNRSSEVATFEALYAFLAPSQPAQEIRKLHFPQKYLFVGV